MAGRDDHFPPVFCHCSSFYRGSGQFFRSFAFPSFRPYSDDRWRRDNCFVDLLAVDRQKRGCSQRDQILGGELLFSGNKLAVDDHTVSAAEVFYKDVFLLVDRDSRMLPGDAQVLENYIAQVWVFSKDMGS